MLFRLNFSTHSNEYYKLNIKNILMTFLRYDMDSIFYYYINFLLHFLNVNFLGMWIIFLYSIQTKICVLDLLKNCLSTCSKLQMKSPGLYSSASINSSKNNTKIMFESTKDFWKIMNNLSPLVKTLRYGPGLQIRSDHSNSSIIQKSPVLNTQAIKSSFWFLFAV